MTDRPPSKSSDESVPDSEPSAGWPVSLTGVTETVVATLGPNDRWNVAALGLFAGDPVTARTWGNTRTRRNFHRRGAGYVQFVDDPVVFTDAALSIFEVGEPVLDDATAWVRVSVSRMSTGADDGTDWEEWELEPVDSAVRSTTVPTIGRGFNAVVEATVAASRLEVDSYDEDELRRRLEYYAAVVDRAGDSRDRAALERVREHSKW
ncbi:DUF447 family protein [Natrarchaeobius halalkaliphilus]|uniref:DUF447 family protein n=1 Tax=Natrarchaeobius halalkaliphilus TaxID=1679091 RepID=A0A3N6MQQ2_9EURY|nr:DUF447 domain-containing protein [Natrarchaeobius halalkaliphilus]RQG86149.1 DUF447 family protein [Natrarchaeobius halalkaliphilus]